MKAATVRRWMHLGQFGVQEHFDVQAGEGRTGLDLLAQDWSL